MRPVILMLILLGDATTRRLRRSTSNTTTTATPTPWQRSTMYAAITGKDGDTQSPPTFNQKHGQSTLSYMYIARCSTRSEASRSTEDVPVLTNDKNSTTVSLSGSSTNALSEKRPCSVVLSQT